MLTDFSRMDDLTENSVIVSKRFGFRMKPVSLVEKLRHTSAVWRFFSCFIAVDSDGQNLLNSSGKEVRIVRCSSSQCSNAEFKYNTNSTSQMISHIERMHPTSDVTQSFRILKRKRSYETDTVDSDG